MRVGWSSTMKACRSILRNHRQSLEGTVEMTAVTPPKIWVQCAKTWRVQSRPTTKSRMILRMKVFQNGSRKICSLVLFRQRLTINNGRRWWASLPTRKTSMSLSSCSVCQNWFRSFIRVTIRIVYLSLAMLWCPPSWVHRNKRLPRLSNSWKIIQQLEYRS